MKYIHIAGTNAKGSVAEFIYGILRVKHKCGVFTSPHLFSPLERMRINGKNIPQSKYDYYMQREMAEVSEKHKFYYWTQTAINWFLEEKVDFAVMETGLGGRYDPTNIIDSKMQILTPISLDHTHILGDTPLKIACEKCGIIKENSTVITYGQQLDVLRLISQTCRGKNCNLINVDDIAIKPTFANLNEQMFNFTYNNTVYKDISINFISPSQLLNATAAAVACLELNISFKEIQTGLQSAINHARCQYTEGLIVDGCHNSNSFIELKNTLNTYFKGKKFTLLLALMEDKNIEEIVAIIKTFAYNVVVTCADAKRGLSAEELAKYFDNAICIKDPKEAFVYAKEWANKNNSTVVVCGSFYLCAEILNN